MTEENQAGQHPPEDNQNEDSSPETAGEEATREEELQAQIAGLESELDEVKDRYLRAHAEMENMRRRMERERSDLLKYGLENFARDILPVLDSFEKALPEPLDANVSAEMRAHLEGMTLLKNQLLTVMRKHGLEPIESRNQPFDPNVHQAIQRIESPDVETETVGEEYARGYLLNGRLVRPAMVSVIVPKKGE